MAKINIAFKVKITHNGLQHVMEIPPCITEWPPRHSTDMKTSASTTTVMAKALEKLEVDNKEKDAEILNLSNRIEAIEQQLLSCKCKLKKLVPFDDLEIEDNSIILVSTEKKATKIKEQHPQLNAEMNIGQKTFPQQLVPWRI